MRPTTAIFINKYHPKADGKCPISIRVTYDRKKKYYPTPYALTISEFEKASGDKPRGDFKAISLKLQAFEKRASDIIDSLPVFTWQSFEKYYLTNRAAKDSIIFAFEDYAKQLRVAGRIGTAVSYECAMNSLNEYSSGLKFSEVTPDFLSKYEKWMLTKGRSFTTISMYLRSLRALFNSAIADGMLSKDLYPFGKKRYEIPTGNNIKKALTLSDISLIYHCQLKEGSNALMARDYWIFMYLCNGINVKDMCLLKYENIKGDILEFERAKTIRTKRKVESIRVSLSDDARKVINRWGNPDRSKANYIFPVLQKGLTPVRERQLIQQITQVINNHMKAIVKDLKIQSDVTTYAARHSFATILQRSGVSTEFISEALGHSNVRTTQNYLAGFEDDSKKEKLKALTAFIKKEE